jgi:hypothetical protein
MNTATETLTGQTVRPVTFSHGDGSTRIFRKADAGQFVYVTHVKDGGGCIVRIPGTLWEQYVNLSGTVEPI